MQTPLRITLRHLKHSSALDARIHLLAERLERINDQIISCHVVVEGPASHGEYSGRYAVRIEITVPGGVINARNAPTKHASHSDAFVAVQDTFDIAKGQLLEFVTA